ncbi:MAG: ABC transporter ATP-binding protein [Cellvibrionaceae bacterium]|nr:ABC transporter ATP-binding protein [Cellvibrionaceae bacterium]
MMAIELSNLSFSYGTSLEKPLLDIPEWSVGDGEQVFIHGPSGSGKSTLLNLLSGILTPNKGCVSVMGQSLGDLSSRQRDRFRANHVGYIFQQFNLIPYLDAIDNVRLAIHFSKKSTNSDSSADIKALLATFDINESHWEKPVSTLSIGQQQRIAIARAMINKPELLIADEPTSSLDQKNRDIFMGELLELVKRQKTSLLFVSHDMSLASYFNRVDALSDINQAGGRA